MSYSDSVEFRSEQIGAQTQWMWIKGDRGAYDGPRDDWHRGHKDKYFQYVNKFDLVVSAGANCGMYTRQYAERFRFVYAFEPDPLLFHCMVNNNQLDNVIKLNMALGDQCGLIGMQRGRAGGPEMNVGMGRIADPMHSDIIIQIVTIDSLDLPACDLIQLDVEGFEKPAITGAKNTIEKFKPVIIAERFNHVSQVAFMETLGYELVDLSGMDAIYVHKERR